MRLLLERWFARFDRIGGSRVEAGFVWASVAVWAIAAVGATVMIVDAIMPKPPFADALQEVRERAYLRDKFFRDACFEQQRKAAGSAENDKGSISQSESHYVITFENLLVSDGFSYRLVVRRSDRRAYLAQLGGFAGGMDTSGPLYLADCLKPTFS